MKVKYSTVKTAVSAYATDRDYRQKEYDSVRLSTARRSKGKFREADSKSLYLLWVWFYVRIMLIGFPKLQENPVCNAEGPCPGLVLIGK